MSTQLALTMEQTFSLAQAFVQSGYFNKGTRDAAQAVVKILYGRELGVPPVASMMGIDVIDGKPSPSATLMASLIQNHPRFDYQVISWDETHCELAFYQDGEERGRSRFTLADAAKANLTGKDNWQRYPKSMLFARAMTQGARAYCAAVFAGAPVYSPDELSEAPAGGDGEIVDGTFTVPPAPEPLSAEQKTAIESLFTERGLRNPVARTAWFHAHDLDVARVGQLTAEQAGQVIAALRAELLDADASDAPPTEDSTDI